MPTLITPRHIHTSQYSLFFEFEHPGGQLNTTYSPWFGKYLVDKLDVIEEERRKGIGKLLLQSSYAHAEEIGAQAIIAAITSRESYAAMTRVFGPDSISVHELGEWAPEGHDHNREHPTSAMLRLSLLPSEQRMLGA